MLTLASILRERGYATRQPSVFTAYVLPLSILLRGDEGERLEWNCRIAFSRLRSSLDIVAMTDLRNVLTALEELKTEATFGSRVTAMAPSFMRDITGSVWPLSSRSGTTSHFFPYP